MDFGNTTNQLGFSAVLTRTSPDDEIKIKEVFEKLHNKLYDRKKLQKLEEVTKLCQDKLYSYETYIQELNKFVHLELSAILYEQFSGAPSSAVAPNKGLQQLTNTSSAINSAINDPSNNIQLMRQQYSTPAQLTSIQGAQNSKVMLGKRTSLNQREDELMQFQNPLIDHQHQQPQEPKRKRKKQQEQFQRQSQGPLGLTSREEENYSEQDEDQNMMVNKMTNIQAQPLSPVNQQMQQNNPEVDQEDEDDEELNDDEEGPEEEQEEENQEQAEDEQEQLESEQEDQEEAIENKYQLAAPQYQQVVANSNDQQRVMKYDQQISYVLSNGDNQLFTGEIRQEPTSPIDDNIMLIDTTAINNQPNQDLQQNNGDEVQLVNDSVRPSNETIINNPEAVDSFEQDQNNNHDESSNAHQQHSKDEIKITQGDISQEKLNINNDQEKLQQSQQQATQMLPVTEQKELQQQDQENGEVIDTNQQNEDGAPNAADQVANEEQEVANGDEDNDDEDENEQTSQDQQKEEDAEADLQEDNQEAVQRNVMPTKKQHFAISQVTANSSMPGSQSSLTNVQHQSQSLNKTNYQSNRDHHFQHSRRKTNLLQDQDYKSILIDSGQGPFLNMAQLKSRVELAATKMGLQQVDAEVYGVLQDTTEHLIKQTVTKMVQTCRARHNDQHPNWLHSKPGDQFNVDTQNFYCNNIRYKEKPQKERSSQMQLICANNPLEDLKSILNYEHQQIKERRNKKYQEMDSLEGQVSSGVPGLGDDKINPVNGQQQAAMDANSQSTQQLDKDKKGGKRVKKNLDPEHLKLKEQKMQEERILSQNQSRKYTEQTVCSFLKRPNQQQKKSNVEEKRYQEGEITPQKLVGSPVTKEKKINVMRSKDVTKTINDIVANHPKKIIVKDLIHCMQSEPKWHKHQQLVYMLRNSN